MAGGEGWGGQGSGGGVGALGEAGSKRFEGSVAFISPFVGRLDDINIDGTVPNNPDSDFDGVSGGDGVFVVARTAGLCARGRPPSIAARWCRW